ncbi:23S rRNA (pseudouridine(1915)-N(3))-methyltransferase RlmH [bacterium]|nr:23S rRNA (pseudouridine(1915)-N(3))-methyltransferase RlmH [bacterium]
MEVQIASVCKTRDSHLLAIEQDYKKRFPSNFSVVVRELGGEKYLKHPPHEQQRLQSALLREALPQRGRVQLVLLDESGREYSTQGLTDLLTKYQEQGLSHLIFAIGGPCGWSSELKEEAERTLALSEMTLPYQLARLFLLEQIYRSYTILSNIPYHR